jgi:hypothetical protein
MTRTTVLRKVAADLNTLVVDRLLGSWALCGALALAVWGAPRATLDIDALADPAPGRKAAEVAEALVLKGWTLVEHARHHDDPVPELLRMACGGVGVDILIAHRNWETAMLTEAVTVSWHGAGIPSVRIEALAAMKLRAGGPQDLVDASRLEELPGFDRERLAAWKKKLRIRG